MRHEFWTKHILCQLPLEKIEGVVWDELQWCILRCSQYTKKERRRMTNFYRDIWTWDDPSPDAEQKLKEAERFEYDHQYWWHDPVLYNKYQHYHGTTYER